MITIVCAEYYTQHSMKTNKLPADYTYVALEIMFNQHSEASKRFYAKQRQQQLESHRIAQQIGLKSTS